MIGEKVRDTIMALPKEDRLPAALDMLSDLLGEDVVKLAAVARRYGLTAQEARTALLLSGVAPRPVTKAAILLAASPDASEKMAEVLVCKLRKRGLAVVTHWGFGYSLPGPLDTSPCKDPPLPVGASGVKRRPAPTPVSALRPRQSAPWSAEEDEELRRMKLGGWELSAIAEELDRSERACADRWRVIK